MKTSLSNRYVWDLYWMYAMYVGIIYGLGYGFGSCDILAGIFGGIAIFIFMCLLQLFFAKPKVEE